MAPTAALQDGAPNLLLRTVKASDLDRWEEIVRKIG